MTVDTERLRALAATATPGPWEWDGDGTLRDASGEPVIGAYSFIGAANPTTVLALLDRIADLEHALRSSVRMANLHDPDDLLGFRALLNGE